ncbi:MAG: DUF5698 domain-containing protein [Clostridiales bacterium]|jgi:uncharacterized protein YebE (UPF0316 family)|nr:DUF5698 domain-containing protein [Clostridiales bacterium]
MLVYLGIFGAKVVEVSLATLRIVLINRGQKLLGSIIGFFEVLIWLFVVNLVLTDVTEDFMKVVVYCFAFSCGNYIGSTIEEKLAIGMSVIEVLIEADKSEDLAEILRQNGYGVTTIGSSGKEKKMAIIKVFLKRRSIPDAHGIIVKNYPESIVSVSDVKKIVGGYIKK